VKAAVPTSLKLPPDLKTRIERIAQAQRRSPHWIMVEAIRQYAEREDGRRGAASEQSWASFQDRAQDEIATPDDPRVVDRTVAEALRRYEEAKTPYDKFMALAGAGANRGKPRSKAEIDAHIRWLRGDD
jgi:predicted transcriptional regulator